MSETPVRSMTGFARGRVQLSSGTEVLLTLKSVNHRFLDLGVRIPAEFDELEVPLRALVKGAVVRGHVDVTVQMQRNGVSTARINIAAARQYLDALQQLGDENGVSSTPDLVGLLRLPGVMTGEAAAVDLTAADREAVLDCCSRALGELNVMRASEGSQLTANLRMWQQRIAHSAEGARQLRETTRDAILHRLRERLAELAGSAADPARVLQEAALLADRSDIAEECARLDAHISQFELILNAGGDCGKKLDFLLQEMHREANTILSKTNGLTGEALRVTTLGLDMKAAIEKCREQVQNIE